MSDQNFDLIMENISKSFPGVKALDKVNFKAKRGEVSAIVGANGAGKSTLMKVLSGFYQDYEGEIFLEGENVEMTSPFVAKNKGVLCLYQEVDTSLVPYLSVAENILMDDLAISQRNNVFNWKRIYSKAKNILLSMNININEKVLVSDLSLSEKQLILIARALSMDSKYLILDEPTAPLSASEIEPLFKIINSLKSKGVGIIYISHRLNEVLEISDTVTILKNGKVTAELITKETTRNEIIKNMLGTTFTNEYPKFEVELGKEILRVENLAFNDKIRAISFSLHEGEILGIAGLVGAGKTELSKALFGAESLSSGEIYLRDKKIKNQSPTEAVKNRFAMVPEERRKEGIMVDSDVVSNLTISSLHDFSKGSFIQFEKENKIARQMVSELEIVTPSIFQIVKNLSGGNQQKIAVGKWLVVDADIFLMDEPTKGVDVGSKTEIFKLVGELAKNKKGIIYFSNELEEIVGIADRVLIMFDGRIVKELKKEEITLEKLVFYCTGGNDNVKSS